MSLDDIDSSTYPVGMNDEEDIDSHVVDDVKETGVAYRPHAYDPAEEISNDAEFGLNGLSLTAAATAGKGLPELGKIDDDTTQDNAGDDTTTWQANHHKDTWK